MEIKQNLVPASKYSLKCPNVMSPIGICVHNTANDAPAKGEISYMVGNALQTSFHIAVDDIEAWQGLPLNRNGWHAGDGGNGTGNLKYIGIEICYSKSGGERFDKAENNAAEVIAQLLKERNWGVEKVKKHQDFSGKYCPARTLDLGWDRFIKKVQAKMGGTMPETITVNKSDWDRVLKASQLGDRLIQGLGYNGNIADKDQAQIDLMVSANSQLKTDVRNKQVELDKVPAQLKEAHDKGFAEGVASVPSNGGNGGGTNTQYYPTGKKDILDPTGKLLTTEISYGVK